MYLTEEEAKTKECKPTGIAMAIAAVTGNATGSPMCTASDCMMWRWESQESWDAKEERHEDNLSLMSPGDTREDLVPTGYCGLAGRPE